MTEGWTLEDWKPSLSDWKSSQYQCLCANTFFFAISKLVKLEWSQRKFELYKIIFEMISAVVIEWNELKNKSIIEWIKQR